MQRAFTEDIKRESGEIRFPRGAIRDFPKETWMQLARQLGKDLSQFTATPEAISASALGAGDLIAAPPKQRRRLKIERRRPTESATNTEEG